MPTMAVIRENTGVTHLVTHDGYPEYILRVILKRGDKKEELSNQLECVYEHIDEFDFEFIDWLYTQLPEVEEGAPNAGPGEEGNIWFFKHTSWKHQYELTSHNAENYPEPVE